MLPYRLSPQVPAVLVLLSLGLACGGDDPGPRLRIAVSPTPPAVGAARVLVRVPEHSGPAADVTVAVRPTGDARGSTVRAEAMDTGAYAADEVPFTTPGEWRIVATARWEDGSVLTDSVTVRVVGIP